MTTADNWRPKMPPQLKKYLTDPRVLALSNVDIRTYLPAARIVLEPLDPPKNLESSVLFVRPYSDDSEYSVDPIDRFEWINEPFAPPADGYYMIGGGLGFSRLADDPLVHARRSASNPIPDFFELYQHIAVASPNFLQALEEFGVTGVELRPVSFTRDSDPEFNGYVFLDPTTLIDAYDYDRCEVEAVNRSGVITVSLGRRCSIRKDLDPALHLFRDKYNPDPILISRAFAHFLKQRNLEGLFVTDPASNEDAFWHEELARKE